MLLVLPNRGAKALRVYYPLTPIYKTTFGSTAKLLPIFFVTVSGNSFANLIDKSNVV
jgi:hypothetical protein